MVTLHLVAKTYGQRPSAIVGIADAWAAYQFDVAVLVEGLSDDKPGASSKPVKWNWDELTR